MHVDAFQYYDGDFMEKESWETIIILILFLLLIAMIILFLINIGITSNILGSMTWIRAAVEALLLVLGWFRR